MRYLRGCLFWLAVVAVIALARCAGLLAQDVKATLGVVMEPAWSWLAPQWRETGAEQAFCVTSYSTWPYPDHTTADATLRVWQVDTAHVTGADEYGVDFECPAGEPEIHEHGPQDGKAGCQPSKRDYEKLIRRGDPFAVVWCDRRAFRFYFPWEAS